MNPLSPHDRTLAAEPSSPSASRPEVSARYELLALLGSGGMGNVYKARDVELDELVAIKVLKPELAFAPGALARFRREVKLARRVTHPNVARVFDIGEHGTDRILTMELVDGESLAALIQRTGGLPLRRAVEIARAICAGVGAAHAAGVVHRDLKPDNVMIAHDGRVVVTDFGIARAASEGARTAGIVGTPTYMAPEQIDERRTTDHRADIYALGTVLYELLVGEPAWEGETVWALAAARLIYPPPDPREHRPELPGPLADLVLRCMARDPDERIASMEAIDAGLAAIDLSEPSAQRMPSRPPPRVDRAFRTTGVDKRVAVLPFANLGPADQTYVANGLTEDLIDALSVARGLRVRSRGIVARYRGGERDPREVGRELDVHVVVEGSIRRVPLGFRVQARLISVEDGFQLWARRFDVSEGELLVESDAIARAIADALTVDLQTPERVAADARAVDLYLRARHAYQRSFSGSLLDALGLYDQVLALTPDDPRALSGRAIAGAQHWPSEVAARRFAFEAAERAASLAPMLPEAHVARGVVRFMEGDGVGAVVPLRRALWLAPSNADAHEMLGRILVEVDHDAGVRHLETAIALEPTFEFPFVNLTAWHELRGERERVEELLENARSRALPIDLILEARLLFWRRDAARASELLATRTDAIATQQPLVLPWLELAAHGRTSGAMPPMLADRMPQFYRRFVLQSEIEHAAFLGDLERALEALGRLDAAGSADVAWLERCPLLEEVRRRPEAEPMRRRVAERAARVIAAYASAEESFGS